MGNEEPGWLKDLRLEIGDAPVDAALEIGRDIATRVPLPDFGPPRQELIKPRADLSADEWTSWTQTLELSGDKQWWVAAPTKLMLESLYESHRELHWRDACSAAALEGQVAYLDGYPCEANPYAGEPADKEWDEDGRGYRSLQASCASLWEMGYARGEFNAALEEGYEQLAAGETAKAQATLKQALKLDVAKSVGD
jgi:hypothetical protein